MSAIFISHSSRDAEQADEVRKFLNNEGYRSLFLDFDPEDGIPPGRNWEQELYSQLRACRALIVLCSKHSMSSDWCFAEITHARALGKHIFPIMIAVCTVRSLLNDVQIIDFVTNRDDGFNRLGKGLEIAGLDTAKGFHWDKNRPPYPGLLAFQEADAPIFFGRDNETKDVLDLINRLKTFGGARIALVIGASGSGKSSLVRAGVVPRLKRDTENWIVLDPFRPQRRPLDELAIAFSTAFTGAGVNHDWEAISEQFRDSGTKGLVKSARDLTISSGARDATILLVIDQVEELLGYTPADEASKFISLLRSTLDMSDTPILVLGTLRSDYLGAFQSHPIMREVSFADQRLGTMSVDDFLQIIEGPAMVAGIDLEPGLSQVMLADTETDDALPLLAFTLRELYERYGDDNRLEIKEYRDSLGGLDGSVARAADAVYDAESLSPDQRDEIRAAFLSLVKIDEEGHYARRPTNWEDLPSIIHNPLERFVEARLLVTRYDGDTRVLEVAHEALFRAWQQMRSWIEEEREFLLWRKRLDDRMEAWIDSGDSEDTMLRGALLREAESWLERCGSLLNADEKRLIHKSRNRAQRRQWALIALAAIISVVVAGLSGVAYINGIEAKKNGDEAEKKGIEAEEKARAVRAAGFLATARSENDPLTASLILAETQGLPVPLGGEDLAVELAGRSVPQAIFFRGGSKLRTAAFSADGKSIITLGEDGIVRIATADGTGSPKILRHPNSKIVNAVFNLYGVRVLTVSQDGVVHIHATGPSIISKPLSGRFRIAMFNPQGTHILTLSHEGGVQMHVASGDDKPLVLLKDERVTEVQFTPDGKQVLMVFKDGALLLKTVHAGGEEIVFNASGSKIRDAVFSPDGKQLLTVDEIGVARLWALRENGPEEELGSFKGKIGKIKSADFSPDGKHVLIVESHGVARLWAFRNSGSAEELKVFNSKIVSAVFSPDGKHLLTATQNQADILLNFASDQRSEISLLGHEGIVTNAVFSPDGKRVLTTSKDGTARIWSAKRKQGVEDGMYFAKNAEHRILHGAVERGFNSVYWQAGTQVSEGGWFERKTNFRTATFSPDGRTILTMTEDGVAQVWATSNRAEPLTLSNDVGNVLLAKFSRDSRRVLVVSTGIARVWATDSNTAPAEIQDNQFSASFFGTMNIALSPNGGRLLHVAPEGETRLWTTDGSGPARVLKIFDGKMTSAAFSPDGRQVLTAYEGGTMLTWASDGTGKPVLYKGPGDLVSAFTFNQDGSRILTVSKDGIAQIWTTDGSGERISVKTRGYGVSRPTFSPDGKRILAIIPSLFGNDAEVWMVDGVGNPVGLDHSGDFHAGSARNVYSYVFAPDGERVVSASDDGAARVWNAVSNRIVEIRDSSGGKILHAIFSLDGKRVLTVSMHGSTRVWNADGTSENALIVTEGVEERIQTAMFSPNGEQLLTVSQDGIARLWPQPALVWQDLLVYFRKRTTACLTVEQRRRYLAEKPAEASLGFYECERSFKRAH